MPDVRCECVGDAETLLGMADHSGGMCRAFFTGQGLRRLDETMSVPTWSRPVGANMASSLLPRGDGEQGQT